MEAALQALLVVGIAVGVILPSVIIFAIFAALTVATNTFIGGIGVVVCAIGAIFAGVYIGEHWLSVPTENLAACGLLFACYIGGLGTLGVIIGDG